jgi:hypothetical protein
MIWPIEEEISLWVYKSCPVIIANSTGHSLKVSEAFEDIIKLADMNKNSYIGGYPIRKI